MSEALVLGNPENDVALMNPEVDAALWDNFVRSHPNGSPFHLMAWQRMIQRTFGHKPQHIIAKGPTGNVTGVLPLFLVRSVIFGRMLISTPQAAYGGTLADSETVAQS